MSQAINALVFFAINGRMNWKNTIQPLTDTRFLRLVEFCDVRLSLTPHKRDYCLSSTVPICGNRHSLERKRKEAMTNKYHAPKWAIELSYLLQSPDNDIFTCRMMALDLLMSQGCSEEVAQQLVYARGSIELDESNTFGKVKRERIPTHAVFNSDSPPVYLESGRLYPISEWAGTGFHILRPDGVTNYCLVENCGHIHPAQWTLVYTE